MTQNVVMYTVEVNTDNSDNTLLPYLTANVRFLVRKESDVLLVPNAALRWSPSSPAQIAREVRAQRSADPPPGDPPAGQNAPKQDQTRKARTGVIWLKDGDFVRPVEVKVGITDGTNTAVESGALQEGQQVVTGEAAETAQSGTQNPFVPQIRKR